MTYWRLGQMQTTEITEGEVFGVIAKRLRAARRHSGLKQPEVAVAVKQKGLTQISLWESGERQPKLIDLIRLSRLYAVPLDFICGLSDDPIADATENNQGFLVNTISSSIHGHYTQFVAGMAQAVAIAVESNGRDRIDLKAIAQELKALKASYARMKELNPDFDDDVRGGSKVEQSIVNLSKIIEGASERIEREIRQCESVEREMRIAETEFERSQVSRSVSSSLAQMSLDILEA